MSEMAQRLAARRAKAEGLQTVCPLDANFIAISSVQIKLNLDRQYKCDEREIFLYPNNNINRFTSDLQLQPDIFKGSFTD